MFFKKYWFVICFSLLAALRIVNLDQDPPNRIISWITPEDEFYYNMGAMNLYDHGSVHNLLKNEANIYYPITGVFTTPFVYGGMQILGDNYWGFRLPLVLFSILCCLLYLKTLNLLFPGGSVVNRICTLFLLAEFTFAMLSRYQTPVGWSICGSIIVLYTFTKAIKSSKRVWYLLLGFSVVMLVLWIYIYTLFVGLAIFSVLAYMLLTKRVHFSKLIYVFAGGILSIALYALISYAVGGFSIADTINNLLLLKSHEVTIQESRGLFYSLYVKAYDLMLNYIPYLFTINIFRFNLILLPLLFLALFFKKNRVPENKTLYVFVSLVIIFAFAQFFIVKTSPASRKLTILLPFIILLIRTIDFDHLKQSGLLKVMAIAAWIVLPIIVLYFSMQPGFGNYDLQTNGINVPYLLVGINLVVATIALVYIFLKKSRHPLAFLFSILIINSIAYGLYYHVQHSTFMNRNNMVALGKIVGRETVAGYFSQGYQLYNDVTTIINPYYYKSNETAINEKIDSLFDNNAARYTIRYIPFRSKGNYKSHETLSFYNHTLIVDTIFTFSQSTGVLLRKL